MKQHTSPFEQFAELVHERAAPPWHWPVAVHDEVIPRPPNPASRAQHTWVPDSHVTPPHATPPLLDANPPLELDPDPPPLEPEAPLDVDPDPLPLEPEAPLDVDPDPLPLEPEAPLDADPDTPLLDPELVVEVPPDPLPDPDTLAEPSRPVPGIRSSGLAPSSPVRPHAMANRAAVMESVLMAFIGGVSRGACGQRP